MNKLLVSFLLVSIVFSTKSILAEEKTKPKKVTAAHKAFKRSESLAEKTLPGYLLIQDSLANDNFDQAITSAKSLLEIIAKEDRPDESFKNSVEKFVQSKDIKEARSEFKNLSNFHVNWVEHNLIPDVEIIFCSMAQAKWVQKKGEIANPYYGSEMKTCGEAVKR